MDLLGELGATERSRDGGTVITPAFESVWPEVERRLRALLFRRGLDSVSADDIVQEVALRALTNRVTYDSAGDLLRWAGPVACNLHVDLVRQRARLLDDIGPEQASASDVHGEVVDRIELERALRGIAALRPADRDAILDAVAEEPVQPRTRKEAIRLAVRRHRARTRLLLLLEQIAGLLGGFAWLRRGRGRRAVALVAVAPVVAMLPLVVTSRMPSHAAESARPPAVAPVAQPVVGVSVRVEHTIASTRTGATGHATRRTVTAPAGPGPSKPELHVTPHTANGYGAHINERPKTKADHFVCVKDLPVNNICVF